MLEAQYCNLIFVCSIISELNFSRGGTNTIFSERCSRQLHSRFNPNSDPGDNKASTQYMGHKYM